MILGAVVKSVLDHYKHCNIERLRWPYAKLFLLDWVLLPDA